MATPLRLARLTVFSALVLAVVGVVANGQSTQPQARIGVAQIEGRVIGPGNKPLGNTRVALLSDTYSIIEHKYTDGSGRFRFRVQAGAYYVDVEPQGSGFERKRERIEAFAHPLAGSVGETFYVDIRLELAKTPGAAAVSRDVGVLFVQEVPEPARAAFQKGIRMLETRKEQGIAEIKKAIEIFPEYYVALETLGSEYVKAGRFEEAEPVLTKAIEVNSSGSGSHYALGVLRYQKARYSEAVTSFRKATTLNAGSANAALYLGLSLFHSNQLPEAEAELERAYELGMKGVPDLYLGLATIYAASKRSAEAAGQLQKMLTEVETLKVNDKQRIKQKIEELKKKG